MCFWRIPILTSPHYRLCRCKCSIPHVICRSYPCRSTAVVPLVTGDLWKCQSAVHKSDFITASVASLSLHLLLLTEPWINPENVLQSLQLFLSPIPLGHGRGAVLFITSSWTLSSFFSSWTSELWFEFHTVTSCKSHIIVVYHLSGPPGNFIDELDSLHFQGIQVQDPDI